MYVIGPHRMTNTHTLGIRAGMKRTHPSPPRARHDRACHVPRSLNG